MRTVEGSHRHRFRTSDESIVLFAETSPLRGSILFCLTVHSTRPLVRAASTGSVAERRV